MPLKLQRGSRNGIDHRISSNPKAQKLFQRLMENRRFLIACERSELMTASRLGYNDHSLSHFGIVAANSLRLLKLLTEAEINPNFINEEFGTFEDAQCIVLLGGFLHDIGNSIHRAGHEEKGLIVAQPILEEIFDDPMFDLDFKLRLISEVNHCICSGDGTRALTVEAGIVKVADGTDCAKGRSKCALRNGELDIDGVSSDSITKVKIQRGRQKPVRIVIHMTERAGIFQVQKILGPKLLQSGLVEFISVKAQCNQEPLFPIKMSRKISE